MKITKLFLAFSFIIISFAAQAQVGIGTNSPAASAQLDVSSTSKGFLPPRMTEAQKNTISSPADGLIVFQTNATAGLYLCKAGVWYLLNSGSSTAVNGDTKGQIMIWDTTTSAWVISGANLGIGNNAGQTAQGVYAVAIGTDAGNNTQGDHAIALGYNAGKESQGTFSVAIGNDAGMVTQGGNAVALGHSAGATSQSGNSVAIGVDAANNTQGSSAVAIGESAGQNTQGSFAVAIGRFAGQLSQANHTVAIGSSSGEKSQGTQAIAIGDNAGNDTQGDLALAFGVAAGATSQGTKAVAIGGSAGATSQGVNAIAIGDNAGGTNQGQYSIAIGNAAGRTNQSANSIILNAGIFELDASHSGLFIYPIAQDGDAENAIAGDKVLLYNNITKEITYEDKIEKGVPYTGASGAVDLGAYDLKVNGISIGKGLAGIATNTAIGVLTLSNNSSGVNNTAIGYHALKENTLGENNTANGFGSLFSNTTGSGNTASGVSALSQNINGADNSAFGLKSLELNQSGNSNNAFGSYALSSNSTGSLNTAIGFQSLKYNSTGSSNNSIGANSLFYNSTGSNNTAIGTEALYGNTIGRNNIGIGYQVLLANSIGKNNTAIGYQGLLTNTRGENNTAIGYQGLLTNTTGTNNTAIGYGADVGVSNLTNATAVGSGAIVDDNNTIQLGNSEVISIKTGAAITTTAKVIAGSAAESSSSAVLEANSTNKGFLPPRMTYAQKISISNPATGLMIYCTNCGANGGEPEYYNGTSWVNMIGGAAQGGLATISTYDAYNISNNTAISGGNVTSYGGSAITAVGICWSRVQGQESVNGSHTVDVAVSDNFTSNMTGLMPGFTYYAKAYVTNSGGTAYGNEITFTTTYVAPEGTTNGLILFLDANNTNSYSGSGTTWNNLIPQSQVPSFTLNSSGVSYMTRTINSNPVKVINFNNSGGNGYASSSTSFGSLQNFSIEVWVNISGTNTNLGGPSIFSDKYEHPNVNFMIGYNIDGNSSIRAGWYGSGAPGWRWYTNPSTYTLNTWVQLVYTFDGTTNKLYQNGTLVGSQNAPGTPISPGLGYYIGNSWGSGNFVYGDYGVVKMYNRPMTSAEVAANFNAISSTYGL